MKKINVTSKILPFLAVLLFAVSCGKDSDDVINDNEVIDGSPLQVIQQDNTIPFSITVSKLQKPLSKKTEEVVDDDDEEAEGGYQPTFAEGDFLEVHGEGISGILKPKAGEIDQPTATFEGVLALDEDVTVTDKTELSATLKNSEINTIGRALEEGEVMEAATMAEAREMYSCMTASFSYGSAETVSLTENNAFVEIKGRVGDNTVTVNSKTYSLNDGVVCIAVPDETQIECSLEPGVVFTARALAGGTSVDKSAELNGVFSIGDGKTVTFSKGNLQYSPSGKKFTFADNQYTCLGIGYTDKKTTFDLFGWGTGTTPTQTSGSNADYAEFNDWGAKVGGWRTLSQFEWDYLLQIRNGANSKNFFGFVVTLNTNKEPVDTTYNFGLILLPDDWTPPSWYINDRNCFIIDDGENINEWQDMANAGAVFLPATNAKSFTSLEDSMYGSYWTSTAMSSADFASRLSINHRWAVTSRVNGNPLWYDSSDGKIYLEDDEEHNRTPYYIGDKRHVYGLDFSECNRYNQFAVRLVKDN